MPCLHVVSQGDESLGSPDQARHKAGSPCGNEDRDMVMGFPVMPGSSLADSLRSPTNRLQPLPVLADHHQSSFRSRSDSEISFGPTRAADANCSSGSSPLAASRPDSDRLELDTQSVVSETEHTVDCDSVAVLAEEHGITRDQMTERIWALEHYFAHSMREAGGALDKRLHAMHAKIPSIKSFSTILHSTQPLAVLMHRPWFPVLMFLLFAGTFIHFLLVFRHAHSMPLSHHRMFRFVPLQSRARLGTETIAESSSDVCSEWPAPPIHSLGLLHNRCKVRVGNANATSDGEKLVLTLPSPVKANGWYFITAAGTPEADPVRFLLEGSNDGEAWEQVGGSGWGFSELGRLRFSQLPYPTPSERVQESWLDLRTPWYWQVRVLARKAVVTGSLLLVGAFSLLRQYWHCKVAVVGCLALSAGLGFAGAVGQAAGGEWAGAAVGAMVAVVDVAFASKVALQEFQLLRTLFVAGVLYVGCGLAEEGGLEAEQWASFSTAQGAVCLLVASGLALFSPRIVVNACRMVQGDRRRLEKAWGRVQQKEGEGLALEKLRGVVSRMETFLPARAELRQCHRAKVNGYGEGEGEGTGRRRASSVEDILLPTMKRVRRLSLTLGNQMVGLNLKEPFGFYDCGMPGHIDSDFPISSLDQLYAQAAGVDPVLSVKVADWAKAFRGSFEHFSFRGENWHHSHHPNDNHTLGLGHAKQGEGEGSDGWFVEIDENVPDDKAELVSSGEIKYTARAIEKLVMCYHLDVSRLLDVCRQRIIFKRSADLVACLEAIERDPDIQVEALTNRLDPAFDATMTLGYRDVRLHVRVVNEESKRLGFETHICEIQLALHDMLHCQPWQAHARFIQFRNQRLHMSRWGVKMVFFLLDVAEKWSDEDFDRSEPDEARGSHHHHHQLLVPKTVIDEHNRHVRAMHLDDSAAPSQEPLAHTPHAAGGFPLPPGSLGAKGGATGAGGCEADAGDAGVRGALTRNLGEQPAAGSGGGAKPLLALPLRRQSDRPPALIPAALGEHTPAPGAEHGDVLRARALLARVQVRRNSLEPPPNPPGGAGSPNGAASRLNAPSNTPVSDAGGAGRGQQRRRRRSFNDSLGDMEQSVVEQLYRFSPARLGARLKVLEEHFIRCALRGHGQLDSKKLSVEEAQACTSNDSVLFTSTALRAALSKQRFRRVVLLYALVSAAAAAHALWVLAGNGLMTGKRFRVTAPALREWAGRDLPLGQEVSDDVFVLLRDGCPFHVPGQRVAAVGPCTLEITLPAPAAVNGWFLRQPEAGEGVQNMSLGAPWGTQLADRGLPAHVGEVCAGVVAALVSHDELAWEQLQGRRVAASRLEAGMAEHVDLRPQWAVVLENVGGNGVLTLGFLLAVVCGECGRPSLGKWMIVWALLVTAALALLSAAVEQEAQGWNVVQEGEVSPKWMTAAGYLIIPTFLVGAEGNFMLALVLSGVYWGLCGLVQYRREQQYLQYHLFAGLIQLVPVLIFGVRRRQVLATSLENIMPNKRRYDRLWLKLQKKEEGKGTIEHLKSVVDSISAGLPEQIGQCNCRRNPVELHLTRKWKTSRNLNRSIAQRKHETWFSKLLHSDPGSQRGPGVPGTIDRCCPVESLDQLYAQARGLQALLQRKVRRWALFAQGSFPLVPQTDDAELQFVHWDQARDNATLRSLIRYTPLKKPGRAIEKALRSYGGDVSRLMDICRESICFQSLRHLTLCLQIISHDKDVIIERVKNRLDPDHDPVSTGGYRDVALNMRLSTHETRGLGIDTHFCEVQLILCEFAKMKHHNGHKNYVEFRNARGE